MVTLKFSILVCELSGMIKYATEVLTLIFRIRVAREIWVPCNEWRSDCFVGFSVNLPIKMSTRALGRLPEVIYHRDVLEVLLSIYSLKTIS